MSGPDDPARWRNTRLPEIRCPFCDHKLDACGSMDPGLRRDDIIEAAGGA